ncbi:hypothetical protein IQ273_28995 [Nodosilinea sp. LEGE 07298]|uniref:hypothetical protein n=1 Tax=Nodosilinea sp. LEGE 07298 TaxID=2777970 RepID=UPI00187F6FED|nr:hypothetical protein [Nodosilinea sp. LEGE 07298]MBE9113418.1 hypothetical protein [Nodosilinea sp. LEGE 07298]
MSFTVIPTLISVLALFLSFAGFWHTRKQFEFANFPRLDFKPEIRKITIKKEDEHNPYSEFYRLSGNFIDVKVVNYSQDVSAIDVTTKVFLSRRKKNNILFNFIHLFEKIKYYDYEFPQIKPGQEVSTSRGSWSSSQPILESRLTNLGVTESDKIENEVFYSIKDTQCLLRIFVEINYKANRYGSGRLGVNGSFLFQPYYEDEEPPPSSLSWDNIGK